MADRRDRIPHVHLAAPDTLLGRLQRGRGDAVRELLALEVDEARRTVLECVRTRDHDSTLVTHVHGYAELLLALDAPLAGLFDAVRALPAGATSFDEDAALFWFHLLGRLAAAGSEESLRFLRDYARGGANWRWALEQFLADDVALDVETGRAVVDRLSEDELRVHASAEDPTWQVLAAEDTRVRALFEARAAKAAIERQLDSYDLAPSAQRRWQAVLRGIRAGAPAAAEHVFDGLWDCCVAYRRRCIDRVNLARPGAVERLRELTRDADPVCAEAARRRLA